MKAAVVDGFEHPPRFGDFRQPEPGPGELLVEVRAAALSNLVKAQAGGKHYSSGTAMPFVPGNDGVGVRPDGQRVYFVGPAAPFGSMAEQTLVPASRTIPLPDSLDDLTAAALGNPGLASWGALIERAGFAQGQAVLINGATGVAGQQAIQAAKYLGARRIIVTGRDEKSFDRLRALGADETISLQLDDQALGETFGRALEAGVDVVLDYLWGRSAELLLSSAGGHGSLRGEPRLRFVQIGSISGETIALPAGLLRSSGVEIVGSGLGSLSAKQIVTALRRMFDSAQSAGLTIDTEAVPLSEVANAWSRTESGRRTVFTI